MFIHDRKLHDRNVSDVTRPSQKFGGNGNAIAVTDQIAIK